MTSLLKFEEEMRLSYMKEGADLKDFHLYLHGLKEMTEHEWPNTILPYVLDTICSEFEEKFSHIVL